MSAETTELLGLPYIVPSQAQKHVTHNEAIRTLDALVQLAVKSRDLAAPPADPAPGQRHIVADGATGAWTGKEGQVAAWLDSHWHFLAPNPGWLAWVEEEETLLVFSTAVWIDFAPAAAVATGGSMLGVNTDADETNRLAVKSDAALFSHDDVLPGTGDMRLVVNKAAAEQTASFLFQDDWSGRAEFGLTGNNDLTFKVSDDGAAWKNAIVIDHATARVAFPAGTPYREPLTANRTYYVRTDGSDDNTGLANETSEAFLTIQQALDVIYGTLDLAGYNVTIQLAAGTYGGAEKIGAQVGLGDILLRGDPTTPSNVIIGAAIKIGGGGRLIVDGVKAQEASSMSQASFAATGNGIIEVHAVEFGALTSGGLSHVYAEQGGVVRLLQNYTINGGASRHLRTVQLGQIFAAALTIPLTGTPAFGTAYAQATNLARAGVNGCTFSGSATGTRYLADALAVIFTNGGGATYLPGNSSGSETNGGRYM